MCLLCLLLYLTVTLQGKTGASSWESGLEVLPEVPLRREKSMDVPESHFVYLQNGHNTCLREHLIFGLVDL